MFECSGCPGHCSEPTEGTEQALRERKGSLVSRPLSQHRPAKAQHSSELQLQSPSGDSHPKPAGSRPMKDLGKALTICLVQGNTEL